MAKLGHDWLQAKAKTIDEMRATILAAWRADRQQQRNLRQRMLEKRVYYSRWGYWYSTYPWYFDPTLLDHKDIIPKLKELSDDEIRWWYLSLKK